MKLTTVLLVILGLGDLAMVPIMIAAHQHPAGQPPYDQEPEPARRPTQ